MNLESLNRQNQLMTLKPVPTSGRSKVTSSIVITMNLGFNSTRRRKKHSLFPLKFVDVTRSTYTDLDVMQEKRIDDVGMSVSAEICQILVKDSQNSLLIEKLSRGQMRSGRRLIKIQTTTRPDHVWPEVWTKIGKAAQNREKQEWAKENQSSTMLEDCEEFTLAIQMTKSTKKFSRMRGENWKKLWLQPCLPKGKRASRKLLQSCTVHPRRILKQCMVEKCSLMNPQGNEWNLLRLKNHEDHIAGKGFTSMSHNDLVHKFTPMPQAMTIPDAKAAVDKEWKTLQTIPARPDSPLGGGLLQFRALLVV